MTCGRFRPSKKYLIHGVHKSAALAPSRFWREREGRYGSYLCRYPEPEHFRFASLGHEYLSAGAL